MSDHENLGLLCWGSGQFGQHGHAIDETITVSEGRIARFEAKLKLVDCGASHTIVVTDSNEVFGWGNGQNGQLGCGDIQQHLSPVRMKVKAAEGITSDDVIVDVACGDRHTCLLLADGRVLCCGSNFYAQLSYDHMRPHYREDLILPIVMPLSRKVTQIACGQYHTVVLYEEGDVACIGRNMYGQIGAPSENAKYDCFEKPKLLRESFERPVVRVATGSNHSLCIDDEGTAFCWGYGRACGLRQGHVMTPTKLRSQKRRIISIDGGSSHTALLTDAGHVLMVGGNTDGQCGLGPGIAFLTNPTQIPSEHFHQHRVLQVVCGEQYTAAFTSINQLFLWGKNCHVISKEANDCRYYEPVLSEKSQNIHRLKCGTWHAAALVSNLPVRPEQECNGQAPTEPSLLDDNSLECMQTLSVDDEEEIDETEEIPAICMVPPPAIGIERERTTVTLAELYAPTPTPRVLQRDFTVSDSEDDDAHREDTGNISPSSAAAVVDGEVAMTPDQTHNTTPSPLDVVRVPSPPNTNPPPNVRKVALKRESLTPLNLNGISHGHSITEDVYELRPGNRVQMLPRRPSETETRLNAPLNRRSSHRCYEQPHIYETPTEPSMVRERSLMVPRTLTFILNDRREMTFDHKDSVSTDIAATLPKRKSIPRPAVVSRRQGEAMRKNLPSLRRSNTAALKHHKY